MKLKVAEKLLKTLNGFLGSKLKHAEFKSHESKGRKILALELTFSDEGLYSTMVLALDKDITESDYKFIGEKLCQ